MTEDINRLVNYLKAKNWDELERELRESGFLLLPSHLQIRRHTN